MTISKPEATRSELVPEVKYGYWFNHLCERWYARTYLVLILVQLVGGGVAVLGVLQPAPAVSASAGLALALAAAISLLVQPAIKAERHRRAKCEYLDLEARAWALAFDELRTQLCKVRIDAPTGLDSLAIPAFNATVRAMGRNDSVIPETALQRLMRVMA